MTKDSYTTADLNPRSKAVTEMRKTVERALDLKEAFDAVPEGQDWMDVGGATYRRIIGERYQHSPMLAECWRRYRAGTFAGEILALAGNLPPSTRRQLAKRLKTLEGRGDDRVPDDRAVRAGRESRRAG